MKIVIPPLEKRKGRDVCPDKCPFSGSGDVCSWCSLGLAKKPNPDDPFFVRSFLKSPGENCPGPGEYQLNKEANPDKTMISELTDVLNRLAPALDTAAHLMRLAKSEEEAKHFEHDALVAREAISRAKHHIA